MLLRIGGVGVVVLVLVFSGSLVLFDDYFFPDVESEKTETISFPTHVDSSPPRSLYDEEEKKYNFGRWSEAIPSPFLHELGNLQHNFQKKEWMLLAVETERYLVGIVVAQFHYAGGGFVYLLDSETKETWTRDITLPLGVFTSISNSSTEGCSTFSAPSFLEISICAVPSPTHPDVVQWQAEADIVFPNGDTLVIDTTFGSEDHKIGSLALSYPIGPNRAAYTHKSSGMEVKGQAKLVRYDEEGGEGPEGKAKEEILQLNGVGLMDWTRSMHCRLTVWFWVAVSWVTPEGKRVGINLSHGVYPPPNSSHTPHSQKGGEIGLENAIWVDDVVHVIDSPLFVEGKPGNGHVQTGEEWECYTEDKSLFLTFTPVDLVHKSSETYILSMNLLHTFGTYSGYVVVDGEKYEIENMPGILEDHLAWW